MVVAVTREVMGDFTAPRERLITSSRAVLD